MGDGDPRPDSKEGEQFGSFALVEKLAQGGMAEIFLAVERGIEGIERRVVVKRILPEMTRSDDFVTMFTDEARLTSQLAHPNIAHIYSFGEVEGLYYIAMEYVDGLTVSRLVRRYGQALPLEVALRLASDVCAGLHYAHELKDARGRNLGVVHRDISPQNIMVSRTGEAKLIDFGVARASTQVHVTGVKQIKGKISYMAPELLRGFKVDRRIDVWAAGVVLFEMATGARLFRRVSEAATVMAITYDDPPSVVDFGLPAGLDRIVRKALERNPERRYATAGLMQHALEELIADLGINATGYVVARFMEERLAGDGRASDLGRADTARIGEEAAREAAEGARRAGPDESTDIDIVVAEPVVESTLDRQDESLSISSKSMPDFSPEQALVSGDGRRRRRGILIGAVALALVAALVGTLVVGIRLGSVGRASGERQATIVATPPTPETPPSPPARGDAGSEASAAEPGPPAAADGSDGAPAGTDAAAGADGEASASSPTKAAPRRYGTLYLDTQPWSKVRIGGRSLGVTPVMGVKLRAGMHTVRLVDPDGRRHTRRVRVRPDQATKAFFRLSR